MPREYSSPLPDGTQYDSNRPAKRQRLSSPALESQQSGEVRFSKSSEEQSCIPLKERLNPDRGSDLHCESKSTYDESGLDQTLLQHNETGTQHNNTIELPTTISTSAGTELSTNSVPVETLTQFCPATIPPSLPTDVSWSTYLEPTVSPESDSILCIGDDSLSHSQDLFQDTLQHEPTIEANGSGLSLGQSLGEIHLEAKVNAVTAEPEKSAIRADVCFGMVSNIASLEI